MHYTLNLCYCFGLNPTKVSILLFYFRIFPTRKFRRIVIVYLIVLFSYMIATFTPTAFLCSPVSYYWDKSIDGKCLNEELYIQLTGGGNMVIDVFILILPMPMVWKLQVSRPQKLVLSGIFALGAL